MTKPDELRCPECGSDALVLGGNAYGFVHAWCEDCDAEGPEIGIDTEEYLRRAHREWLFKKECDAEADAEVCGKECEE